MVLVWSTWKCISGRTWDIQGSIIGYQYDLSFRSQSLRARLVSKPMAHSWGFCEIARCRGITWSSPRQIFTLRGRHLKNVPKGTTGRGKKGWKEGGTKLFNFRLSCTRTGPREYNWEVSDAIFCELLLKLWMGCVLLDLDVNCIEFYKDMLRF